MARKRVLYPRLLAMNLDQPEAQAYYGMKNKCTCSKCKRRKGRSAHRRASRQSGSQVNILYNIVENPALDASLHTLATEKLMRWGFNPERRCLLTSTCDCLLVRAPGSDEVFPGLDYRDKLHGLFSFLFRAFDRIFQNIDLGTAKKQLLEKRLLRVCLLGSLRNTRTNRSYRVQRTLFNAANLGTVDKVCILFLLPHVLGHEATAIPQPLREDLLSAISLAQRMIVAARDNRSYTVRELDVIFNKGFISLFRHLESLNAVNEDISYANKMQKHHNNPDKHARPKRFRRQERFGPIASGCFT